MFRVLASTPESMGAEAIARHARRAEAMGFDGLLIPDAIHDALVLSALALNATQRLCVTTGVLVAFARSPMVTAVAAWDLQRLSGGRFRLGVGTQIQQNIEQRYSARWGSPVPQLREYVQALKAIFHTFQTGAPLAFAGEHYQFSRLQPFFNPGPSDCGEPPILCGAVGPAMSRMVGRVADGVITHPTSTEPAVLRQAFWPNVQAGLDKAVVDKAGVEQAGRAAGEFTTLLSPLVATGVDATAVQAAYEQQRRLLAFLFSTPAYWRSLECFGWQDRGEQLREMTRNNRWQDLPAVVTDELLHTFVAGATYPEIARELCRRLGGLGQEIIFPLPEREDEDAQVSEVVRALQCGV